MPVALNLAVLAGVALAVCICGHIAGVDGEVCPVARQLRVQPFDNGVDAPLDHRPVLPQLFGEAVGGIDARRLAFAVERTLQRPVLADQGDGLRPGRQRIQALGQAQPDHRADRVAGTARPARPLKLGNQMPNLGRIEKILDHGRCRVRCYLGDCHSSYTSDDQAPGSSNFAGAIFVDSEANLYCPDRTENRSRKPETFGSR
jgi:hypothetical protein